MRNPSSTSKTTTPCCSKVGIKRGPWTAEEDEILANFVKKEGEGRWRTLPKRAGLHRCGKSCRLRWMNYLRPSVKRGHIAPDEEDLILRLHRLLGNRWSLIAGRIPGRTDNDIKNYWNTHLSKKLISQGIDPRTHKPLETHEHKLSDRNSQNTFLGPRSIPEIGSCSSSQQNQRKATENNWNGRGKVMGLEVEGGGKNNNERNIGEDDTLSSFLDSLINDNEGQGIQELELQADQHVLPVPTLQPLTSSMQSFDLSCWEAEFRSVVGDEHYGSLFK